VPSPCRACAPTTASAEKPAGRRDCACRAPEPPPRPVPRQRLRAAGALPATLPGIDLDTALARLGGNRDALVSLLKRFEQSQGGTVAEVRALLAAGQRSAGQRNRCTACAASRPISAPPPSRA
jgi:hypothetical protein